MNYKETLFFIGKSLTIAKNKINKTKIEETLQSSNVNWESVVKVSTAHYVLPAICCNYKKVGFLKYLPEDLVEYMEHITNLNRERNEQIIAQAKEINELLIAQNINPIFLKGTGNLLEGLYEDIAERMVGDIDFIVDKQSYLKSVNILKSHGYYTENEGHNERTFHWHYAKLIKKKRIASVEVHNKILSKTNNTHFDVFNGEKKHYNVGKYTFFKNNYKLLNTTLPKILNDNLYLTKTISLRTVYDVFLISKLQNLTIPEIFSKSLRQKLLNYIACMELVFNEKFIEETNHHKSKKYLKKYNNILNGNKFEEFQNKLQLRIHIQKSRFSVFFKAFSDKEYRNYAFKRVLQKDLYKRLFTFK